MHAIIGILAIAVLVVVIGIILFSIFAIVTAVVGGTSTALLVKNRLLKNLLFIGFGIVALIGILCIVPIIGIYLAWPLFSFIVSNSIYIGIAILTILGIYMARKLENKIVSVILIVIFALVLICAISLFIFSMLTMSFWI